MTNEMRSPEHPIHESLAFVLHRATTLVDRAADLFLRERHDISYSLFSVLLIVGTHEGATQREVADMLGVSRASITQRTAELVAFDLVRATPHPHDARAMTLSLTAHGGELLTAAWHDLESADDAIDDGVDVPALLAQLGTIITNATAMINTLRNESAS